MFSLPLTAGCNSDQKPFDGGSFLLFLFCSLLLPCALLVTTKSCRNDDITIDISPSLHHAFPKMIPIDVVPWWHSLLSSLPFCPYAGMSHCDNNASTRLSSPSPSQCTSITCFVVVLLSTTIPATIHHCCAAMIQLLFKI